MQHQIAEYDEIKRLTYLIVDSVKPQKIYLFGSFVRGEQTENSDYDFCVIVDDNIKNTREIATAAHHAIGLNRKRPIDILAVRNKDFEAEKNLGCSLFGQINQKGVIMYE